jgi:hypothetical protein
LNVVFLNLDDLYQADASLRHVIVVVSPIKGTFYETLQAEQSDRQPRGFNRKLKAVNERRADWHSRPLQAAWCAWEDLDTSVLVDDKLNAESVAAMKGS